MMELWAAIDLMGGHAVTLVQGRAADKTEWNENPVELAERWQREGADGLHIVDLDAAFGKGSNRELVVEVIKRAGVPVQVGGGVRRKETADELLKNGVTRVVLGTLAYERPSELAGLLKEHGPGRLIVAADYKDGQVVTKGWREGQGVSVERAAEDFERLGVTNLLATSVGRDGTASGPDVETVRTLALRRKLGIVASGGIRDVRDLRELKGAGARGAIIGRALYEGSIKLEEAKEGIR